MRQREWHPEVIEYIRKRREECPRIGQEPLKKELEKFCKEKGIKLPSTSTIARIIRYLKDKGKIPNPDVKVSFYAKTGKVIVRKIKKKKKLRRGDFYPQTPGDLIQIDSVYLFLNSIKMYIISAIDVRSRFAFALAFKKLSSESAREFMEKFLLVFPYKVKCVQTDNGSEFAGKFDDFLKKKKISHFYIYPKRPQENGYIERFNRTLHEYFIEWNTYDFINIEEFNKRMIQFLLWYNTIKSHFALKKSSPLEFMLNQSIKNRYESKMLWNYTRT